REANAIYAGSNCMTIARDVLVRPGHQRPIGVDDSVGASGASRARGTSSPHCPLWSLWSLRSLRSLRASEAARTLVPAQLLEHARLNLLRAGNDPAGSGECGSTAEDERADDAG